MGDWNPAVGYKMLSWIERVVPQPPVIPPTPKVVEKVAKPEPKGKESKSGRSRKKAEGKSSQPAEEKKEAVATPGPASMTDSSGRGVLTWLSDGLEKVVPQPSPPGIVLHHNANSSDAANQTDAQNAEDEGKRETAKPTGVEGEVQPSSDTNAPETTGSKTVFNRLLEEFEKMIPQPENVKKTEEGTPGKQTADQGTTKGEPQTSPTKPLDTHRASVDSHSGLSLFPRRLGGDGGSMFKRIMQGLEKAIPQPVSKEKPVEQKVEAGGQDPGQESKLEQGGLSTSEAKEDSTAPPCADPVKPAWTEGQLLY